MNDVNADTIRDAAERRAAERPQDWSLSPLKYFHIEQEPWVFVHPDIVRTVGDANAGLLLADILRWFRPPEGEQPVRRYRPVDVNGVPWLAKPIAGYVMETGLTDAQVSGALKRLRTNNLIVRNGRLDLLRPICNYEAISSRGIRVYARTVHMTRSAAQGIILSQMHYWFSPGTDQRARVRHQHQG